MNGTSSSSNEQSTAANGSSAAQQQQQQMAYMRRSSNSQSGGDLNSRSYNNHPNIISMSLVSDGWLELFLTPSEKASFSKWNEVVRDKSLVSKAGRSSFEWLATKVPNTVSPNTITLSGLIMLVQAWYVCHAYGTAYPVATTWLAVVFVLLFFGTSHVSGYHADRIRQHTPLSDLFKYACDSGSTVFLALLLTYCLGASEICQWHAVQAGQLVLLLKHLSAFKRHAALRYRAMAGPGEVLFASAAVLTARAALGLEALQHFFQRTGAAIAGNITVATDQLVATAAAKATSDFGADATKAAGTRIVALADTLFLQSSASALVRLAYYGLFAAAVAHAATLPAQHSWTRFGLLVSLLMRLVPALLLQAVPVNYMDIICDGLFMAVLTCDLSLAKMSRRELHPWVVLMSLASVLSYSVILTLVAVYFIGVFSDLCFYLNLPLLAVSRNVYCDGVYDLCHIGHKRAFQNALQHGNRLFVGVMGDKDCANYKRPPIMTHAERCAEVEACKSVTKVIPNAPCFGLTQEFLDEHQIHVVAFGEEYLERYPDPNDDPYYGYPRKLGMAHTLPRTNTLSTSELIGRIRQAPDVPKKSPT